MRHGNAAYLLSVTKPVDEAMKPEPMLPQGLTKVDTEAFLQPQKAQAKR